MVGTWTKAKSADRAVVKDCRGVEHLGGLEGRGPYTECIPPELFSSVKGCI